MTSKTRMQGRSIVTSIPNEIARRLGATPGGDASRLAVALTFFRLIGHELNVAKTELLEFVRAISRNEMNQGAVTNWPRERIT